MGEQKVSILKSKDEMQAFVKAILNDVQALEHMLDNDFFESDIIRIGAEQEMCIVNSKNYKPAPINLDILEKGKKYKWLDQELARFNLETNLTPHVFTKDCLSKLENENLDYIKKIRQLTADSDSKICLTGILPTLRKHDLELHNLTPVPRYFALMESIRNLRGNHFELRFEGIDELHINHQSPLLEAVNTSFQIHLQVTPKTFVPMYNIAQVLAAPVMAIAANSPIVFGKRLWHESRIAMFQQAIDTRTSRNNLRENSPRVHFGNDWLKESILEIYKEDITRFRVLLAGDKKEDSIAVLKKGKVPKLRALQVHNSTVYRWNRPCYGISDNGKPHLRIENRVIPAGPTILDATANAALWLGAMVGMHEKYSDITKKLSFADAADNFKKAAKFGIDSTFNWIGDKKINACDLILKEIIPLARLGLNKQGINKKDIDKYLGVIEQRAKTHTNGARWQLRTYTELRKTVGKDEALAVLTAAIVKNQEQEIPVHKWKMPKLSDLENYRPSDLKVEELMTTDIFTVQKDDLIDLVMDMMHWNKVRYMPIEDAKGHLVGLISTRQLLKHASRQNGLNGKKNSTVADLMVKNPVTIHPEQTILEAMELMQKHKVGCLPVTSEDGALIGILTEMDFVRLSARLIERLG